MVIGHKTYFIRGYKFLLQHFSMLLNCLFNAVLQNEMWCCNIALVHELCQYLIYISAVSEQLQQIEHP